MARQRQQDEGRKETDERLLALFDEINLLYGPVIDSEKSKIRDLTADFEKKSQKQRLKLKNGAISQAEFDTWLAVYLYSSGVFMNARDEIAEAYVNADSKARKAIYETLYGTYAGGFNYGTFQAETISNRDTKFKPLTEKTVRKRKRVPFVLPDEKEQKRMEKKDRKWNRNKVYSAVLGALSNGGDVEEVVTRVEQVGRSNISAIQKTAVTKTNEAENKGRLDAYKRAVKHGIPVKKMWRTMLDERVRESHVRLEHQVRDIDERFSNGLMYPGDPHGPLEEIMNCRCILEIWYGDIQDILNVGEKWRDWKKRHGIEA